MGVKCLAQATQPASPVWTPDPFSFFPAVSQPLPLLPKLWLFPVAHRKKLRPLWLALGNVAVLREPLQPCRGHLALCSLRTASVNSLASLDSFLGPPARRTKANEPGLPCLPDYALLGARGQRVSGLLPAGTECTVGRGMPLWASVSPYLQRGAGTGPEKPREADLARPIPSTRLANGARARGKGRGAAGVG